MGRLILTDKVKKNEIERNRKKEIKEYRICKSRNVFREQRIEI
jgi:hypothetical protein